MTQNTYSQNNEESIELAQLIGEIQSNWRFIVLCGVVIFSVVMSVTMLSGMEFQTSARLYLGEVSRADRPEGLNLHGEQLQGVATEVEILRSRYLVQRAIVTSGANMRIVPAGWSPPSYLHWLMSGRDLSLLGSSSDLVVATDVQLAPHLDDPVEYRIKFTSDVAYTLYSGTQPVGKGQLGERLEVPNLTMTLLPGTSSQNLKSHEFEARIYPLTEVVSDMLKRLEILNPESDNSTDVVKILELSLSGKQPQRVARILQHLIQGYMDERQAWKVEDASAVEDFIGQQLQKMRASLNDTQQKLAEFRSANKTVVSKDEAKAMVEQVNNYEEQRVAAKLQVTALDSLRKALDDPNAPLEAFLFGEADDSVLRNLAKSLSEERRELAELRSRFQDAAPDVVQQKAKVRALRNTIRNYVNSRQSRAKANLAQLDRVIVEYDETLKTLPVAELGLEQIGRESEVYSKMYLDLLERQQQTALVKAAKVSKNRVLDAPEVPRRESSPRLMLRLASGVVGLLIGTFVVIVRVLMSSAIRTDSEIRLRFEQVPVLAFVPRSHQPTFSQRQRQRQRQLGGGNMHDIMGGGPENFAFLEAFRTLRTNLINLDPNKQGQVVVFSSPGPGDGKTTCVLSLASALAADGKRVLVVDADIRKPTHHELTGVGVGSHGLHAVLSGKIYWQYTVQAVELSQGSFHLVVSEQASSAELLSSMWLDHMLEEARTLYDFILLDVASYPMVSDALVVAKFADVMVSVFRLGHTSRKTGDEHMRGVATVARSQALVINGTPRIDTYGYAYQKALASHSQVAPVQKSHDDGMLTLPPGSPS